MYISSGYVYEND